VVSTTLPNTQPDENSEDSLELSTIYPAPFQAFFSWNNVDFKKCRNAPFTADYFCRISYDLNRKHLSFE